MTRGSGNGWTVLCWMTPSARSSHIKSTFPEESLQQRRLALQFSEGDPVFLNLHCLSLLRSEKGRGRKLLMKYDGPSEVIQKLCPVSYWLWMPASYGIHPIINIAHLERYQPSPAKFGNWPTKNLNCEDFEALPECEVNKIFTEWRKRSKNCWKIIQYLTQFKGYTPDSDKWLTSSQLKNVPEILEQWKNNQECSTPHVQ
jgi:hypothetical protein